MLLKLLKRFEKLFDGTLGQWNTDPVKGFKFPSALDLNMGYFTIPLAECSKDVTTIVTKFGEFRYTCLPTGMVISDDIFQAKVYDLIRDIESVCTYIDDILCIGKGTIQEHLDQLEEIFQRFSKAGLKVNAPKCSFDLKEIPYLGYTISMDGLKPDPKKVLVYAKDLQERSGELKLSSTLLCYDLFSILKPFLLRQLPFLIIDVPKNISQA